MKNDCWNWKSLVACSVLLPALVGCPGGDAKPPTYPVTGVVKLKGTPVDGATIVFVPLSAGTEGATGKSDADGKYTMTTFVSGDGVMPGDYMVKVFKFDQPPMPPSESSPDFDPNAELVDEGYDPDAADAAPVKNHLPKKYASEVTSGLKLTATTEPVTFDIDLQ